ncbi:phage integrase N-terminal domain-containing protein [Aromatoleum evansii]|uniref:phage integrase N-terminal domain-containing protein n=1 Tax=Aromatoleum evansii TaxID=59406 RepID=UPI00145E4011|nr:phage integrase N-terminal domain-containing protein [Aromatoleum evansii]NMG30605.1 Fis family transcriptional regulator [Aromatoleum evansii]
MELERELGREHFRGWKDELTYLLSTKGRVTARDRNGLPKPVSNATLEKRRKVLFQCINELHGLGYRIKSLKALKQRHVRALGTKWAEDGLSASTIQNRISLLRTLGDWIGKPGMIGASEEFVPDRRFVQRTTNAQYDHSWSAAGVDAERLIGLVSAYDARVGMQLRLCQAFYLRRQEAVMFRPHQADQGTHIVVRDGTKGGRERVVPVETEYQRKVLDEAKAMVRGVRSSVADPSLSLKQALDRFSNVCARFGISKKGLGVTAHGLRHQGLNDLFESVAGVPSPIRTEGDIKAAIDTVGRDQIDLARARVSEAAGHARLSISGSYIGGLLGRKTELSQEEQKRMDDWMRFMKLKSYTVLTAAEEQELQYLRKRLLNELNEAAGNAGVDCAIHEDVFDPDKDDCDAEDEGSTDSPLDAQD